MIDGYLRKWFFSRREAGRFPIEGPRGMDSVFVLRGSVVHCVTGLSCVLQVFFDVYQILQ